jgi:hypothetical protein
MDSRPSFETALTRLLRMRASCIPDSDFKQPDTPSLSRDAIAPESCEEASPLKKSAVAPLK